MKTREKEVIRILSPLAGEVIPITQVNDPIFSEEMLGKGVAIRPSGEQVVSPINGTVTQMFESGHAVSVQSSDNSAEVLIHVGLKTMRLKSEYFRPRVKDSDKVSVGDVLFEFDSVGIIAAGFDMVTPVVICNSENFENIKILTGKRVNEGDEIIVLTKKRGADTQPE